MPSKKKPKQDTILVVCAHSDDQIFGVGGTLAKYSKEGKNIKTIIFSYGENSHPWLKEKVTIQMRVKESYEADRVIGGGGVLFYNLKEGNFVEEVEKNNVKDKLKKIFLKHHPSKIFTHSIDDPHPDHKAVVNTVLDVFDQTKLPNSHVYTFDVWSFAKIKERHYPKFIVPIKDTFKLKLKALKCFESQWAAMLLLLWSVYARAFVSGIRHKALLAEKFYKVR